jgi:pyruvate dehydrogenase E2 component (dihydrolipoamide acetyltransferase)
MVEIIMPQVGQDLPSARIVNWLKKVGDPVKKGEVVAVVESEKASFDVESETSGILLKVLFPEGAEVEVFKPIALVGEDGGTLEPSAKPSSSPAAPLEVVAPCEPKGVSRTIAVPVQSAPRERISASPAARRRARETGVDLGTIHGTGPDGRIITADIEDRLAAATGQTTRRESLGANRTDTTVPFSPQRRQIADRLTQSKQSIPHFYLSVDVDMTEALGWRTRYNQSTGLRVTCTDLIIKASALALDRFPRINSWVAKDRLILKQAVNIGVAVSVEDGVLVPVIPTADRQSLKDISRMAKENAEHARHGKLPATHKGTFTISSLGMHGIRSFLPIINPPECAILAVGTIAPRVTAADGSIRIRDVMDLTLAADHRAVDGVIASEFLNEIKSVLENLEKHHAFGPVAEPRNGS